ncbi:MAG: hypothetical protein ACEQSX_10055 [Baekduiaceae bacterium]
MALNQARLVGRIKDELGAGFTPTPQMDAFLNAIAKAVIDELQQKLVVTSVVSGGAALADPTQAPPVGSIA